MYEVLWKGLWKVGVHLQIRAGRTLGLSAEWRRKQRATLWSWLPGTGPCWSCWLCSPLERRARISLFLKRKMLLLKDDRERKIMFFLLPLLLVFLTHQAIVKTSFPCRKTSERGERESFLFRRSERGRGSPSLGGWLLRWKLLQHQKKSPHPSFYSFHSTSADCPQHQDGQRRSRHSGGDSLAPAEIGEESLWRHHRGVWWSRMWWKLDSCGWSQSVTKEDANGFLKDCFFQKHLSY